MYVQSCELYDVKLDQWTLVAQLTHPASCQPHIIISAQTHGNECANKDCVLQLLLFGGHSFGNDTDHHWLQAVTLHSDGLWRVEDLVSLSTHGVLYYTATVAKLPAPYLRQFDRTSSANST